MRGMKPRVVGSLAVRRPSLALESRWCNTTESDIKFLKHGNGRIYQRRRTADVVVTFARRRVLLKKLAAEKIVNKALVAVAPLLPRVCANHLPRKIIVCFFEWFLRE